MNRLNGKNEEDRRIYERSARLLLLLALRDIAPGAKARFDHSIGRGIYLNVSGVSLTASLVRRIEARMHELSRANLPIVQSRWTREQAVEYFRAQGQEDTVRLLTYRPFDYFDVYTCDGLSEYFYGGMAESTGEIESFALRFYYPGMVLLLPDEDLSGPPAPFVERPKLMRAYVEANVCSKILQCENAADLNDIIAKGEARTFIRVSEAMQERAVAQIAERIVANGARVVFVAGPSSSGKTTFANRLSVQLRARWRFRWIIIIKTARTSPSARMESPISNVWNPSTCRCSTTSWWSCWPGARWSCRCILSKRSGGLNRGFGSGWTGIRCSSSRAFTA